MHYKEEKNSEAVGSGLMNRKFNLIQGKTCSGLFLASKILNIK